MTPPDILKKTYNKSFKQFLGSNIKKKSQNKGYQG